MRRTRIERPRRSTRVRPGTEDTYGLDDLLDPRDPDIVRAKRVRPARHGGGDRL
ncbi:hypothetical protein [Streptomyces sp. S.PB5]|uniref:hypothetical protein n=1 Tax=Streptomyces sp. S.PB5 TaxID=3020844 RepID=UPI0025AFE91E|nr:hypothetical protein [Streptomyces sp. S.PB5]MDN3021036.1 hypothetical protein [Streptomyces sp. S.PB5]